MMKRLFVFALILSCASGIFAQNETPDNNVAMGIGPEFNMNSRYNFAMGGVFGFDANLPHSLALGFTFTASYNFNGITVVEPAVLFRWYFLGTGHKGFFAQADMGGYLIFEDGDIKPMVLGGLRGGYRFTPASHFYLEPYGRLGYPFAFGIGVMAGLRF